MLKEGFLFTFISAFMALFPVANPVGAGFLVNGLLSGLDDEDRKSIIRRIITDYLLVGLGSLAVGHFVLTLFGLSLPVIQLGGGLLICRTALQWLSDSDSSVGHAQGKDVNPLHKIALESQVFYPITFPISITVESVTIHSSVYPYCAPAARFEAQLPGSMNPTVTSSPGPMYLKISNPPIRGL